MDAEQERRIELLVAALRLTGLFTEEDLAEARDRGQRLAGSPIHRRIDDLRVQGGSGP